MLGAQNLIEACLDTGVQRVVALSTDKAAAPINLYGATKLCSDKLFVAANNIKGSRDIRFSVVRYGNVMGSRGSVIPLFLERRASGVLPITDERMTRFNISLQEGVDMVLWSIGFAWAGEILVPKIPSYRITDVATAIGPECRQELVGLRPGEKIHEEMITASDSFNTVDLGRYFSILPTAGLYSIDEYRERNGGTRGAGGLRLQQRRESALPERARTARADRAERDCLSIPMTSIPYSRQDITEQDVEAVASALRSDFLTQGPGVPTFEAAFAARHEVRHAVAVANATAGLHIACLALGLGPGDRAWTTPNSFVASANCVRFCGASVDFVDIDAATRNMSLPALRARLEVAARDGSLPKLVIPVDFAGLPCDLREMRELADRYGFRLLSDSSHATGASYQGRPIGGQHAHATVFSFHAVKIVTTAEGGMVATQDDAVAQRLRLLRSHGITRDPAEMEDAPEGPWYYEQQVLGFNYRLTDLQAALGTSQLRRLDGLHARRIELADRYDQMLAGLPLRLPARLPDRVSAWHLYVVEIDAQRCGAARADVFARMRAAGIGVNVHYIPIHLQPDYRRLGFRPGDFPAAERYYGAALTLPLFPAMSAEQQARVVEGAARLPARLRSARCVSQ